MEKDEVIRFFQENHARLVKVVETLTEKQMLKSKVLGNWNVKEIIAHISAWNWEIARSVDEVLANQKPWYVNKSEKQFNLEETEKRKNWSLEKVLQEWKESFKELIQKIREISDLEWEYAADFDWGDATPVSVKSLFGYRYREEGHEGGHAKQIREHFKM